MGPMPKALTETQEAEIRRNYKPCDNVSEIGRYYGVCYNTIKRTLGKLYVPCKTGKKVGSKAKKTYNSQSKMVEDAARNKIAAQKIFDNVSVGQNIKYRDTEGVVIQKTENLIVIKADRIHIISKSDIIQHLHKEMRAAV